MLVTTVKTMPKPNPKLAQPRKDRGFTMIELIITVLILGILTTMALPSFRNFIASQRIKSASFDLMSMVSLARSEAIKRNTNVTVTPAGGNWQNGWTVAAGANTLGTQNALTGLTIDCWVGAASTACPANITYANNGRLDPVSSPSPFPSFRIFNVIDTTSANTRCINIDLSGRPNSKKGNC